MADTRVEDLRCYHPDRASLLDPASGPDLFDQVPNPSLACMCAELSRLAYKSFESSDEQAVRRALKGASLDLLASMSVNGAQAFAAGDGQRTFLVFRGTQSDDPTDLGTDADFRLGRHAPFPGRVHSGFARSMLGLLPALNDFLERAAPAPRLVLTGHSLGAALATLAASVYPDCHLVTFGSPRVGDADFVAGCSAAAIDRYVDCADIVTHLPPEKMLGYAHAGPMRYIDRDGLLHTSMVDAAFVAADRDAARLHYLTHYAFVSSNAPARDLADHAPANYIRALV